MTSFVICIPSRGTIHSRTIEAVLANVREAEEAGYYWQGLVLSHDLPIPACDEDVAERGLASGADALWFVEEDVIPPSDALRASLDMLVAPIAAVAVDYPVGSPAQGWGCIVRDAAGAIVHCGLGCTVVAARALLALPRPWFSTAWRYIVDGDQLRQFPTDGRFGQQDIYFCRLLTAAGMRIAAVPGMVAGHAYIEAYGRAGSNEGYHTVRIRQTILRQYPGNAE